ncbi:unnamed protein product (mitochondrion) [Plasmodiophora brassicae]|uniref:Uncharacterized protein n=2 Tax=Plasmodiophora brassicae TaxID=37360 RepID=A0A3P3YND6_PLABS|nr:unnamed protein product [Plasmodiophora brassicae]
MKSWRRSTSSIHRRTGTKEDEDANAPFRTSSFGLVRPRRATSSPLIVEENAADDAVREVFHQWSVRFSLRIEMCAQMAFDSGSADDFANTHRILMVIHSDEACGLQIDSFDVFTAAELVSEVGECAAIVERNFNSKSFHEQPHMLVPVYTILEGVLRIIPKFLRRPSPRTPRSSCDNVGLKRTLQTIVDEINRDNARHHGVAVSPPVSPAVSPAASPTIITPILDLIPTVLDRKPPPDSSERRGISNEPPAVTVIWAVIILWIAFILVSPAS